MDEAELWRTAARWIEAGAACALCTVIRVQGAVPRHPGAKLLVRDDGTTMGTVGGGALELQVTETARAGLASASEPRLLSFQLQPDLGMLCGGAVEVFVEPLRPPDRLYVFGAGHIGQAHSPIASRVGFAVTVVDERAELATRERFPEAVAFVPSFAVASWGELRFDVERTYCVIVSPSHKIDFALARELLARPTRYVGMIGSQRKRRAGETDLLEAGIPPPRIGELRSPIGEPIGAETPEEIAVSIVAELIRVRRGVPRTNEKE